MQPKDTFNPRTYFNSRTWHFATDVFITRNWALEWQIRVLWSYNVSKIRAFTDSQKQLRYMPAKAHLLFPHYFVESAMSAYNELYGK